MNVRAGLLALIALLTAVILLFKLGPAPSQQVVGTGGEVTGGEVTTGEVKPKKTIFKITPPTIKKTKRTTIKTTKVTNVGKKSIKELTREELKRAFEEGFKKLGADLNEGWS